MTTDEPQADEPIEEEETESSDEPLHAEKVEPTPRKRTAGDLRLIRNFWVGIGVLTLLLIISMVSNRFALRATVPPDSSDVAAVRADLETRRAELNRQRAELNLPPLPGQGEDVSEITARLRSDAATIVSLIDFYQQQITEKDRILAEKNMALIRSEQVRESLTSELGRAQTNATGTARLQDELSDALVRANRLADDLAAARSQIAEHSNQSSAGEIETLKRRLDEAARARDFFEQRATELESSLKHRDASLPEESDE